MFTKASVVAFLASAVAAQHAPVGEPQGNPITRPLIEVVPACKPFQITWEPTTRNTVSLILLRGPSSNVVPLGAPLAVGIPNSGSFSWTPSADLEADATHYGLQLIDDVNGQYQYSTQFGISKDDCKVESKSVVVPTPTATVTASVTGGASVTATADSAPSATGGYGYGGYPVESSAVVESSSAAAVHSSSAAVKPTTVIVSSQAAYPTTIKSVGTVSPIASTGAPNSSLVIQPTGGMSVPESLRTSATSSATLPESTGAASGLKAGLGLVGAAAAAVFMF
jgi:hypothetical protein